MSTDNRIMKIMMNFRFYVLKAFSRFYSLTRLADESGSDKGALKHNYTKVYSKLFEPFRDREINILEIGLNRLWDKDIKEEKCPSLNMWERYFPKARVFGFDLRPLEGCAVSSRTRIFQGNQGSKSDLMRFTKEAGVNFDIIIDDGSHASNHQQLTLGILFPFVKSGGLYIIEDLQWQPATMECEAGYTKEKYALTSDIFTDYLRVKKIKGGVFEPEHIKYLEDNIENCAFYESHEILNRTNAHKKALLIIRKR